MKMHLAKLLVREGLVSVEQIRESIEYGDGSGFGLGESLAALGYVTEQQLVEFLSRHYGVPSMDIDACETDESVLRLIPMDTALEKFLVPISVEGPDLTIADSDPSNILMLDDLGFITGKNIKPVVASERSIRNKLNTYYGKNDASRAALHEEGSGEPGIEVLDVNTELHKKNEEDLVFDFTDGNVRRDEIPSAESGGGPDLNETDIDTSHEMSVSAAQDSDPGPEDPAPQDGNGILIHGVAEDAADNELGAASTTGRDTDPGAYDMDTQSNESHEEKAGETISSERITGAAFETPRVSDSSSNGDGNSPSVEETSAAAPVINGPASPERNEKMHEERGSVLIVDFSPTVRKIMRISLERAGYKVVSAGDGMQALASINESIPDLIFVDIKLPHMDGYQLCKVIKSHGLTKEVPVVMLSGKVGVLDKMKIKMAGASDFITKPFGSEALVGAAEKYAR
jgi:CheY-like chemotaxis protein